MSLAWLLPLHFFLFLISLLTLIKKTPLLSKYLNTRRLTVRAMSILDASWQHLANFPSFLPAQRSCKDNFLADYFSNITEFPPTTAKVYHSLLFSFRLFLFHAWLLYTIYLWVNEIEWYQWSASQFRDIKYITLSNVIEKKVHTTSHFELWGIIWTFHSPRETQDYAKIMGPFCFEYLPQTFNSTR